jgi:hypothetical protein
VVFFGGGSGIVSRGEVLVGESKVCIRSFVLPLVCGAVLDDMVLYKPSDRDGAAAAAVRRVVIAFPVILEYFSRNGRLSFSIMQGGVTTII